MSVYELPGVFRVRPRVDDTNAHFWRGGAEGALRLLRCRHCGHHIHPPAPICRRCHSRELEVAALSGRGRVHTFTVNHQPWNPTMPHPYVVALVEIEEEPEVRLVANIVGCPPEEVHIGMAVEVCFERIAEDCYLPQFRPPGAPLPGQPVDRGNAGG